MPDGACVVTARYQDPAVHGLKPTDATCCVIFTPRSWAPQHLFLMDSLRLSYVWRVLRGHWERHATVTSFPRASCRSADHPVDHGCYLRLNGQILRRLLVHGSRSGRSSPEASLPLASTFATWSSSDSPGGADRGVTVELRCDRHSHAARRGVCAAGMWSRSADPTRERS